MPLLALLLIACQVFCGLHVVRSGQERYWIYLIIALPGLGCLIYALGIMLPDLLRSRHGRRAVNRLHDRLDPERHLRTLRNDLAISDTRETRVLLADELLRLGQAAEAVEHYRAALRGIHAHAPDILLGLARAQFAHGEAAACRLSLEQLREHNPDFRSADGHLLYAQALAQQGEVLKAVEEYRALLGCSSSWGAAARRASCWSRSTATPAVRPGTTATCTRPAWRRRAANCRSCAGRSTSRPDPPPARARQAFGACCMITICAGIGAGKPASPRASLSTLLLSK
jgi:hypothetical protein